MLTSTNEFDCIECGRHMIVLSGPDTNRCAACIAIPGWYLDAEVSNIIDPERRRNPKERKMGEAKRRIERLGDAPVQEKYHNRMVTLARVLDELFNDGATGEERETGFVLLVFPFGDAEGERCNFISNGADRKDIVNLFKEMIARFEGQPEVTGSA